MIVAHAHEALLQAFYKVSKKVAKNQKMTQVSMFRDLMTTLVDEACYEGDEVVQELEILRDHRLPDHGRSRHFAESTMQPGSPREEERQGHVNLLPKGIQSNHERAQIRSLKN